jgi:HPt (histidine-containing phosphotransfer) domain-containing protein
VSDSGPVDKLISELVREDPDMVDIVEEFVKELPKRLAQMQAAYTALNWKMLRTLAHQLKGAGGSYGYQSLTELATEMEAGFSRQQADQFQAWMKQLAGMAQAAEAGLKP